MRYRLYREHKFVIFGFTELERLIAKTDFRNNEAVITIKEKLGSLSQLMTSHAQHEDIHIHELLRKKNSTIYEIVENDHKQHEIAYDKFQQALDSILNIPNEAERLELGYKLYLDFRLFFIENLKHLYEEETIILPELQRLYSDEELRKIDAKTYGLMTEEQMVQMLEVLSPHMDKSDLEHFIYDIKHAEPIKYAAIADRLEEIMRGKS